MTDIEHIKQLALALESPDRASSALATLHEVAKHLENGSCQDKKAHPLTKILKLKVVQIPGRAEPLKLLLHKAVFSPEEWAKTFAEGLLKTPELFQGKSLVELGTGSGWISLLLLAKTSAHDILGLDINPYAVYIARLNAWLNGTDEEGAAVKSVAGVPIFKAFKVRESDLLSEPLKRNAKFDHIIGCIPQVLHPDQSKLPSRPDDFSERELYDLSNYCFQQGILEDRFGLPLIARALEEAQLCLRPHGKVTLVLGGRPGPQAIDAMFRRRGWEPTLIWSRRIQQADDTDLCSLVEIERRHQIRFHFFLSRDSEQSLSAETAVRVLSEGKPVYHDLLVYQATTRSETATLGFVHNLHKLGLDGMRKELDFSRVSEELISFLNRFSSELIASRTIAYPHERGDIGMREALAKFLRTYCYYPITAAELFLAPERPALLDMVLKLVLNPGDRVLLSRSLEDVYRPVLHECGLEVILGNDDLAELIELDDMLAPKASIIAPQQLAQPSPLNLSHISGQAEKHPDRWYVVDDSAQFMITSQLGANMTLRLAGQRELPANLVFLYGLVKSSVCSDFEMSFLINAPQSWLQYFDVGAELTYSRMPFQVQLYYQWLFEELLAFPFQDPALSMEARRNEAVKPITKSFNSIAADPVFAPKPVEPGAVPLKPANQAVAACGGVKAESEIIRLDYG
ncbi:MAG TPA: 50S ribosomal protein L11 methyltransferase, partial [Candidatus Obscuribacterales bacterium]